jgi:YD repeat-containing protein
MKRFVLLAACFALPAFADVTVTAVNDKDGKPHSVTYIASGKIRTENLQGSEPSYMLWQVGAQQMTVVMPSRKSYMVMDKAQLEAQMKQVNEQMKQMEAQLASLPPEMREMMKKQMPNMGTGKPLIEMKVTKTGKSGNKGGYACQMVDIAITGVPMAGPMGQEHCVVAGDKLGLSSADLNTVKMMAEFAKSLTKELGQVVGGMPDVFEMGGWPVWTREKQSGESYTLKTIDKGAVSASLFTVPAGFKEEKMPTMGDMGGKRR